MNNVLKVGQNCCPTAVIFVSYNGIWEMIVPAWFGVVEVIEAVQLSPCINLM